MHRFIATALVFILTASIPSKAISPVYSRQQAKPKIAAALEKLGAGNSTHVAIVLRNAHRIQGNLTSARPAHLVITDYAGVPHGIAPADITGIHGNNLSTGAKVGIGVGAAAAVLFFIGCGLSERGFCRN